ncbi:MAG: hypothetical protein R2704_16155 [Microthrixaceae bacterium]
MFDTNGWRHTIIICDLPDDSPVEIDLLQREHAHVEENIKRLKTTGLDRFPFPDTARNKVWTAMVGWAHTLSSRWFPNSTSLPEPSSNTPTPKSSDAASFEHRRSSHPEPANLDALPKHWPWNPQLRHCRTAAPHHEHPHTTPGLTVCRPEHPAARPNNWPGYLTDPTQQPEQPSGSGLGRRQHPRPIQRSPPHPEPPAITPKQPSGRLQQRNVPNRG